MTMLALVLFICFSSVSTDDNYTPVEEALKIKTLQQYAPRIWMDFGEEYFPSSVEWAFPNYVRYQDSNKRFSLTTKEKMPDAGSILPFFAGQPSRPVISPIYSFWDQKIVSMVEYVDLVYWAFFPYNLGKKVLGQWVGNHVGDWEHVTVRCAVNNATSFTPLQIYYSYHSWGNTYDWNNKSAFEKIGDHPVVYTAKGSHGMWSKQGCIRYTDAPFLKGVIELEDCNGNGTAWDTWNHVSAYDWNTKNGLGENKEWPSYFRSDFTNPGEGDPTMPTAGAIHRWGNPEQKCGKAHIPIIEKDYKFCVLEGGPTGPPEKGVWGDELQ